MSDTNATTVSAPRVVKLNKKTAYKLRGKRAFIKRIRNEAKMTQDETRRDHLRRVARNETAAIKRFLTSLGLPTDYRQ